MSCNSGNSSFLRGISSYKSAHVEFQNTQLMQEQSAEHHRIQKLPPLPNQTTQSQTLGTLQRSARQSLKSTDKDFISVQKHRDIVGHLKTEQKQIMKTNQDLQKELADAKRKDLVIIDMEDENKVMKAKVDHLKNKLDQAVKFLETYKQKERHRKSGRSSTGLSGTRSPIS